MQKSIIEIFDPITGRRTFIADSWENESVFGTEETLNIEQAKKYDFDSEEANNIVKFLKRKLPLCTTVKLVPIVSINPFDDDPITKAINKCNEILEPLGLRSSVPIPLKGTDLSEKYAMHNGKLLTIETIKKIEEEK